MGGVAVPSESQHGGHDRLLVTVDFVAPTLVGGETTWPSSFPDFVECSRTFGSDTHTVRIGIGPDPRRNRVHPVDPVAIGWGDLVDLHVPSSVTGMGRTVWLPTHTTITPQTQQATHAVGGAPFDGVHCVAGDGLLHIVANEAEVPTAGTARCDLLVDGVSEYVDAYVWK